MTTPGLVTRGLRALRRRYDATTVPRRNAALDATFGRNRELWLSRCDAAVGRGRDWLAPQADASMSVLFVGRRTLDRGVDDRFGFVEAQLDRYRRTLRDPALRLFDAGYDPEAEPYRHLPHVMEVRPYVPVELLMLDTVWADVRPQPDILDRLAAFDDCGAYGTTHIVVGGLILLANRGAPADATARLIASTVAAIAAANDRTARAEDIFAERTMVLQWLDRHDLVRPAWILRLLRAQRADGGWQAENMPPVGRSNQHTTIVAMAALAEFRTACLKRE